MGLSSKKAIVEVEVARKHRLEASPVPETPVGRILTLHLGRTGRPVALALAQGGPRAWALRQRLTFTPVLRSSRRTLRS